MAQDKGASAEADRAATPSGPGPSVSGSAGIPCANRILTGFEIAEMYRKRRDAADAMYDTLEAFVDAWNDIDSLFQPQMPRLIKRAEAALAKARGQ